MSTRLRGLAATTLIAILLIAIPTLLIILGPNPFTGASWQGLTGPDDGTLMIVLIKTIAWIAWALLALALLLEIAGRLRGAHAPHLPGLGIPQHLARDLVATAALLFTATTGLAAPAMAAPTPAPITATATATATTSTTHTPAPITATATAHQSATQHHTTSPTPHTTSNGPAASADTKTVDYTVRPGDSLWSIAQHRLGDPHRFPEIAQLNQHLLGEHSGFLMPGTVLHLPADATTDHVTVQPGDTLSKIAQERLGDADAWPQIEAASASITQPDGQHLTNPDQIEPGWTLNVPTAGTHTTPAPTTPSAPSASSASSSTNQVPHAPAQVQPAPTQRATTPSQTTPAQTTPTQTASASTTPAQSASAKPTPAAPTTHPTDSHAQAVPTIATSAPTNTTTSTVAPVSDDQALTAQTHTHDDSAWMVRTGEGVGAILAIGVIGLIAQRRRTQQSRRRPGQSIPMPDPETMHTEQALREIANPITVETVDRALRHLAATCANTGHDAPDVRAARLTADTFELYLAAPATLPAPWVSTADDTVWQLPASTTVLEPPAHTPAPYPALVTIGHDDEDGHVLLNLEHLGSLSLQGPLEQTRSVLAALAIEMATSAWADDIQITIVGAYPELEDTLHTGRIRYLPALGHLIDDLTIRATRDRDALGEVSLPTARATQTAPDTWTPEILLIAGPVTTDQHADLARLVQDLPRVAIALVTTQPGLGEWSLELDGTDQALVQPIGLELRPQMIPAEQYRQLLEIASAADPDLPMDTVADDDVVDEPTLDDVEHVHPAPTQDAPPASSMPRITATTVPTDMAAFAGVLLPHDLRLDIDEPTLDDTADPDDVTADTATSHGAHTADVIAPDAPAAHDINQEATAEEAPASGATAITSPANQEPAPEGVSTAPEVLDEATITTSTIPVVTDPAPAELPDAQPQQVSGPTIQILGKPTITGADGPVEPSKRGRLLELAAYLALNPGASYQQIDTAIWPDRSTENNLTTRNTATSKLRRWLGTDEQGNDYLPRFEGEGYRLQGVRTDLDQWRELVGRRPLKASTEHLEAALQLVRGVPFEGVHPQRYAWAELLRQQLISEIVDAAYELSRRRLMAGRWLAAEQAVVVGLRLDPANEALWRLRILAAHSSRNEDAEREAVQRFLVVTEQLGTDLEPETAALLDALNDPTLNVDDFVATV